MNKKQLLIAAVATVLSVSCANATSTIDGFASGTSGTFNIDPAKVNGDVGYRQYQNFTLGQGDIANLIFKYNNTKDINTFINLVQNGVNVNGILNTVRNGNFYNGHAVFISPDGLTVGASGVLNVGSLSVATPSTTTYNKLLSEYSANNYENINNVSHLLNGGSNYGAINIDGKVFARNGVQIRGGNINVGAFGGILNGVNSNEVLTTQSRATQLFNSLVNTTGMPSASVFTKNGSNIQIKADQGSGGINIQGKIVNGAAVAGQKDSGLYITNNGNNGTKISGLLKSTNELNVYNKAGNLDVSGTVKNANANLNISNKGGNMTIGGTLSTNKDLAVTNNSTTGALTFSGTATPTGKANFVNEGAGGMNVTGAVTGSSVRFVNRGGKLVISNTEDKVASAGTVRIENSGNGGMSVAGVKSESLVSIENKAGDLNVNGKVSIADAGAINILNSGNGKLAVTSNGNIAGKGTVSVKNRGANGMTVDGTISNRPDADDAETAIINENGAMLVNGTIDNMGNMTINNKGTGVIYTKNATVTNEGKLKLKNYGADGMKIVGAINNTGDTTVYNDAGQLALATSSDGTKAGNITNNDGRLVIYSRENSTGISAATGTKIINNAAGESLAIKHEGRTVAGQRGIDLQGTITNGGKTAINNYSGDMYVSGNIQSDGDLGIINRAGGGSMTLAKGSTVTSDANINIKNYGSGDMTVNNEITNNGRLNVLANEGKLNLGGTVHNNSNGALDANNGFYAAARANGTGINVTSGFVSDGAGQTLIKNISGQEGLRYQGNMTNSGSQSELYNQKGNMTVGGAITTTGKGSAVVLNKGDGMTVNGTISSEEAVRVVNKGTKNATVDNTKITAPGRYFWEQLKK